MRWTRNVQNMRNMRNIRNTCKVRSGNPNRRYHLAKLGIDERIILTRILRKLGVGVGSGNIWLRIGFSGASYEHSNETSGNSLISLAIFTFTAKFIT